MNDIEYQRLADLEDRLWHFEALHGHVRQALDRFHPSDPLCLLDAGCGAGGLLKKLKTWRPQADLRGLDVSPLAVRIAGTRSGCSIEEGSATALPYADATFDAITSIDVLYHIEHPEQAVAEFARGLKKGGLVILNVPAYRWLWSYHDVAVHSYHRFTRSEMKSLLLKAGLRPLYSTYWNTLLFPAIVARRKLLPAPKDGNSDVREYPPVVSKILGLLLRAENSFLRTGLRLPFGTSVFIVGQRQ